MLKKKSHISRTLIVLLTMVVFIGMTAMAQRFAVATGNWSGPIWATTAGGVAGSAAIPTSTDVATINAGVTVTVDVSASCASLTFTSGNPNVVTAATISNTNSLTITGALTINGQGSTTAGSPNTMAVGAGTLSAGSVVLTGVANSASKYAQISIATGTVTVTGNITSNGSECRITFTGAGTLYAGGTFLSGTQGTFTASTGTVNFNAAGPQAIAPFAYTFNNVVLSGSGAKTLTNATINGTLSLSGTATVTTTAAMTIGGNLVVGSGTTFTAAGFALTVTGTTTVNGTLTISSVTGTKAFNSDVTINTGGIWNNTAVNATLTLPGSLSNSGTFNAGTGVHTLTGTAKTINGTISIPSVTVNGTYTNNSTLTIGTALAGTGTLTNGATGVLNISGTIGITNLAATTAGNTVNYTGAAQTAKVTTYYNLTLSGSGVETFATTPTVNGVLSLEGTASIIVTTGVVTYGPNATLQYNKPGIYTATTEEWITPFAATGGIIIKNVGAITTPGAVQIGNNTNVSLNINSGATLTPGANLLTFHGDFINAGTLTSGSGGVTIAGTAATQNIGGFTTTGTVSMTKTSGTATFTSNVNGGAFTLNGNGGTLNLDAGTTGLIHTFTGTFTRTNGTLNCSLSTLNINGATSGAGGTFSASNATVIFGGTSAQNVFAGSYLNVTINKTSGTATLGGAVTATSFTLTDGIFDASTYLLASTTTTLTSGTLRVGASTWAGNYSFTPVIPSGFTIEYYNGAQTVATYSYYDLILSGSGTKTFAASTTISDNVLITGTAVANLGTNNHTSSQLTLGGNGQVAGTWGGTGSGATNINTTYFAANTGRLTIAITQSTWKGTTSTAWGTAGNWSSGAVPTAATNIFIPVAANQPIIAANAVCKNMTIASDATLTIGAFSLTVSGTTTVNGALTLTSATRTKTFTGPVIINNGGSITENGNAATLSFGSDVTIYGTLVESGAATVGIAGSLANNGSYTASTGTHTFSGSGKTIGGTVTTSIPSIAVTGTYTNNGTLTVGTALTGTGGLTQAAGATLNIGGTATITTLTATSTDNTVNYNGGAAQATCKVTSYANLTISGIGAKTFATTPTVNGLLSLEETANIVVSTGFVTYGTNATLQYNKPAAYTATAEEWITPFAGTGGIIIANTGTISTYAALTLSTGVPLTINTGSTLSIGAFAFTVGSGTTTVNGTITLSSATGTKTFTGPVLINIGGTMTENGFAASLSFGSDVSIDGTLTESGAATVDIAGSFTNNGTYTAGTGTHTFSGNGMTIGGTTTNTIPTATFSGTYDNTGTLIVGTLLTITGTLTNDGTINATTALSGSGGLTQGTTGVLNIGGTAGITALTASANGNTVNYNGTSQSVTLPVGSIYHNLTLSGSGIVTLPVSSMNINGDFIIGSTVSTSAGGTLSIGGNWTNNGGTFTPGSNTVIFNGSAAQNINGTAATQTFNNVTISGGGNVTIGGSTTTLHVGGNWTDDGGSFSAGSCTVIFDGTAIQNVNGSTASQTFHDLTINNSSGITFGGTSLFDVGGSMTITNGTSLELAAGPVLTIENVASVTTLGTGKIILDAGANYINLSTSAPMLQVQTSIDGSEGWRMLAAPDNVSVGSMFAAPFVTQGFVGSSYPSLQPNLLWWDETSQGTSLQAWRKDSVDVTLGRGYMFYVFNGAQLADNSGPYSDVLPLTMTATGVENPLTSAFDFGVTATSRSASSHDATFVDTNAVDYGWNLVGNPTPSTINWDASSGWTKTNMDESIYVWDPSTSSYKTWNGFTGNLNDGLIGQFQAFWVKANATSPSLKCDNGVKATGGLFLGKRAMGSTKLASVSSDSTGKKSTSITKSGSIASNLSSGRKDTSIAGAVPVLELELTANEHQTKAYLEFSQSGKMTYDPLDAFSLVPFSDTYLILYSVAGNGQHAMQIQNLPNTGFAEPYSLPLYVGGAIGGQPLSSSFTLRWKLYGQLPTGWNIMLMDDAAGKADSMIEEGEMTFQYDTPVDLIPSSSSFLQKKSGAASNQQSLSVLPRPVVYTVPVSNLSKKSTSASRFRMVITTNNDVTGYLPMTPELAQNYPNPFNPTTNISFSIPAKSRVTILVFNILGQRVATVADQEYSAGSHVVVWNASNVASGVYFYRMTAAEKIQTKKMVVLR